MWNIAYQILPLDLLLSSLLSCRQHNATLPHRERYTVFKNFLVNTMLQNTKNAFRAVDGNGDIKHTRNVAKNTRESESRDTDGIASISRGSESSGQNEATNGVSRGGGGARDKMRLPLRIAFIRRRATAWGGAIVAIDVCVNRERGLIATRRKWFHFSRREWENKGTLPLFSS